MAVCPNCGDEIPPKPVGQVGQPKTYCSVRCRSAMQKQRERGGAESWDRSDRRCVQCETVFAPVTRHHVHCSSRCRKRTENARRWRGGTNQATYRLLFIEERGGGCERCGVPDDLELHHIVSVAAGGSHRASNVLVLCRACHGVEDERAFRAQNP
jgi:5-methylcytosine-specific restriction endonuclease McrA